VGSQVFKGVTMATFYYVNWDDYTIHEIDGEYITDQVFAHPVKHARIAGEDIPVIIDSPLVVGKRKYFSSMEMLMGKLTYVIKNDIEQMQRDIERMQTQLTIKNTMLVEYINKTRHLLEWES
jgi:hypothetical protein